MEINYNGFKLSVKDVLNFVSKEEILSVQSEIQNAEELLKNKSGK